MYQVVDLVVCVIGITIITIIYEKLDIINIYFKNITISFISSLIGFSLRRFPNIMSDYVIPIALPHFGTFATLLKQPEKPITVTQQISVAKVVKRNNKLYLEIPYEYRNIQYKILYLYKGKRELLSATVDLDSTEESCLEKIQTYIGPCGDFHNQAIIPADLLNNSAVTKLRLQFSDSDTIIQLQGNIASLIKKRIVT